jgi:hypothetical protein
MPSLVVIVLIASERKALKSQCKSILWRSEHGFQAVHRDKGCHGIWDRIARSNANVDAVVKGSNGRDLALWYKGDRNTVTVPDNVPIVTFAPATRDDLLPGKKVFVVATPTEQGGFEALRGVVEKEGVAPPM